MTENHLERIYLALYANGECTPAVVDPVPHRSTRGQRRFLADYLAEGWTAQNESPVGFSESSLIVLVRKSK